MANTTGPGSWVVQTSSQAWATAGSQWSNAFNSGWILDQQLGSTGGWTTNASPTSSGGTFASSGDGTTGTGNAFWSLGRALRVVQGVTTLYAHVTSASVSAGVTSVGFSTSEAGNALSTGTAITSAAGGIPIIDTSLLSAKVSSSTLAADVPFSTSILGTYNDGPSLVLGVASTAASWMLFGSVDIVSGTSAQTNTAKLWDGTTVLASADILNVPSVSATWVASVSLVGLASSSGTWKISVAGNAASTANRIAASAVGNNGPGPASYLRAIRIT